MKNKTKKAPLILAISIGLLTLFTLAIYAVIIYQGTLTYEINSSESVLTSAILGDQGLKNNMWFVENVLHYSNGSLVVKFTTLFILVITMIVFLSTAFALSIAYTIILFRLKRKRPAILSIAIIASELIALICVIFGFKLFFEIMFGLLGKNGAKDLFVFGNPENVSIEWIPATGEVETIYNPFQILGPDNTVYSINPLSYSWNFIFIYGGLTILINGLAAITFAFVALFAKTKEELIAARKVKQDKKAAKQAKAPKVAKVKSKKVKTTKEEHVEETIETTLDETVGISTPPSMGADVNAMDALTSTFGAEDVDGALPVDVVQMHNAVNNSNVTETKLEYSQDGRKLTEFEVKFLAGAIEYSWHELTETSSTNFTNLTTLSRDYDIPLVERSDPGYYEPDSLEKPSNDARFSETMIDLTSDVPVEVQYRQNVATKQATTRIEEQRIADATAQNAMNSVDVVWTDLTETSSTNFTKMKDLSKEFKVKIPERSIRGYYEPASLTRPSNDAIFSDTMIDQTSLISVEEQFRRQQKIKQDTIRLEQGLPEIEEETAVTPPIPPMPSADSYAQTTPAPIPSADSYAQTTPPPIPSADSYAQTTPPPMPSMESPLPPMPPMPSADSYAQASPAAIPAMDSVAPSSPLPPMPSAMLDSGSEYGMPLPSFGSDSTPSPSFVSSSSSVQSSSTITSTTSTTTSVTSEYTGAQTTNSTMDERLNRIEGILDRIGQAKTRVNRDQLVDINQSIVAISTKLRQISTEARFVEFNQTGVVSDAQMPVGNLQEGFNYNGTINQRTVSRTHNHDLKRLDNGTMMCEYCGKIVTN